MSLDSYSLQKIRYSCEIAKQLEGCEFGKATNRENLNALAAGMCIVRLWETCKAIKDPPVWDEVGVLQESFPEVPWETLKDCAVKIIHPRDSQLPWETLSIFYAQVLPRLTQWCNDKQKPLGDKQNPLGDKPTSSFSRL